MLLLISMSELALDIRFVKTSLTTITVPDDYSTIQEAVNHANPGDTIYVRNGTYLENIVVNTSISLIGENRSTTIIDGNFTGTVLNIAANNVKVVGFTIQESGNYPNSSIYISEGTTGTNITGNIIARSSIGIRLNSSTLSTICQNIIRENSVYGVLLHSSSNNTILDNYITHNDNAIYAKNSLNNTIIENEIINNQYHPIWLEDLCNYNVVSENNMKGNGEGLWLWISCSFNVISKNNVVDNGFFGIGLYNYCENNIVEKNNITNNNYGVKLYSFCKNNRIFHNNFIDNDAEVAIAANCPNTWDDGYPSGGNYWDSYLGSDIYSGISQNKPGGDGLCDAPYVLDPENQDRYPLTKLYSGQHDIGITHITASKTVVGEGRNLTVALTILNYGVYTEQCHITIHANATYLLYQTFSLAMRSSKSLVCNLTMSIMEGNYTITARLFPVAGETYTIDNTLQYAREICITIPGDVDADFDVDLYDAVKLLTCYGKKMGEPNYDPNCDIDGDGRVFLFDAVILCSHYGQKYP